MGVYLEDLTYKEILPILARTGKLIDTKKIIEIDEAEMEYLYKEFGLEKDDNLTDRAKEIKRAILMGYIYGERRADE